MPISDMQSVLDGAVAETRSSTVSPCAAVDCGAVVAQGAVAAGGDFGTENTESAQSMDGIQQDAVVDVSSNLQATLIVDPTEVGRDPVLEDVVLANAHLDIPLGGKAFQDPTDTDPDDLTKLSKAPVRDGAQLAISHKLIETFSGQGKGTGMADPTWTSARSKLSQDPTDPTDLTNLAKAPVYAGAQTGRGSGVVLLGCDGCGDPDDFVDITPRPEGPVQAGAHSAFVQQIAGVELRRALPQADRGHCSCFWQGQRQ